MTDAASLIDLIKSPQGLATAISGAVIGFIGGKFTEKSLDISKDAVKFFLEYKRENARRRGEIYNELRKTFDGDEFKSLYEAINTHYEARKALDDVENQSVMPEQYIKKLTEDLKKAEDAVRNLPLNIRERFAAFVEHVALITKSDLISYELANYEFGWYSILCADCEAFWDKMDKGDAYWALYEDFVSKLRPKAKALKENPKDEIEKLRF